MVKPLLLSVEYANREKTNTTFIELNKELHMDHILPQAYAKEPDWNYIDDNEATSRMNKLGNMALLYYKKNEEALNKGFKIKANIYQGKNEDGTPNNNGMTSFDTTREVVDVYEKENRLWNIDDIDRRYEIQLTRIEDLLSISDDQIENEATVADPTATAKKRATRFNFVKLGIEPGSILTWYNDPSITCKVINEHDVEYNGEKTSISTIASEKAGRNLNGALYFTYYGKTISRIREEVEAKKQMEEE